LGNGRLIEQQRKVVEMNKAKHRSFSGFALGYNPITGAPVNPSGSQPPLPKRRAETQVVLSNVQDQSSAIVELSKQLENFREENNYLQKENQQLRQELFHGKTTNNNSTNSREILYHRSTSANNAREFVSDDYRNTAETPNHDEDEPVSNNTSSRYPVPPSPKIRHQRQPSQEEKDIETIKKELLESEDDPKQDSLSPSEDSEDSESEPVGKWRMTFIKKIDDLTAENKILKSTLQELTKSQSTRSLSVPARQVTPNRTTTPPKSIRSRFSGVAHLLSSATGTTNETTHTKSDKLSPDDSLLRRRKSDASIDLKRKEEPKPEIKETMVTTRFISIKKKETDQQVSPTVPAITDLNKLAKVSEQKTVLEKKVKEMDGQLDAERKKTARLIKENAELEKNT